jgi:hypothetical protein
MLPMLLISGFLWGVLANSGSCAQAGCASKQDTQHPVHRESQSISSAPLETQPSVHAEAADVITNLDREKASLYLDLIETASVGSTLSTDSFGAPRDAERAAQNARVLKVCKCVL